MPGRGQPDLMNIAHEGLTPGPNYRRTFDDSTIAELADSIDTHGLLQNLVVTRPLDPAGAWIIVSGERRWRAIGHLIEAGRWPADRTIPCQLREELSGQAAEIRITALIENLQREDVNAMEEAEVYAEIRRLDPARYTTSVIAREIGKSDRYVQQRLALAERLPDDVKAKVRDGTISVTQARELAIVQGEAQRALAALATDGADAQVLRTRALSTMFDLSLAKFDEFDYQGAVHTLDDGSRWAIDRAAALDLQRAWAKARATELGSAVIEVTRYWQPAHYGVHGGWRLATGAAEKKKAVTLVVLRSESGAIEEIAGMTTAKPDTSATSGPKPKKLPPAQQAAADAKAAREQAHQAALQKFTAALPEALGSAWPTALPRLPQLPTKCSAFLRVALETELTHGECLYGYNGEPVISEVAELLAFLGIPLPAEVIIEGAPANPVRADDTPDSPLPQGEGQGEGDEPPAPAPPPAKKAKKGAVAALLAGAKEQAA